MSDTPRTDQNYVRGFEALTVTGDEDEWVRAEFARKLERELAVATELLRARGTIQPFKCCGAGDCPSWEKSCQNPANYAEDLFAIKRAAERVIEMEKKYSKASLIGALRELEAVIGQPVLVTAPKQDSRSAPQYHKHMRALWIGDAGSKQMLALGIPPEECSAEKAHSIYFTMLEADRAFLAHVAENPPNPSQAQCNQREPKA